MEGTKIKNREKGIIGIVVAIGVVLILITAGTAAGMTLSAIHTGTRETPGSGGCGGIPDGGSETLHTDIRTTTFGGCASDGKSCGDGSDNCLGSSGISTGCSAPTKMYAALPLSEIAAKCQGDVSKCSRIQVINPTTNKSAVLAVIDSGPCNTVDKNYVLGTARPLVESGQELARPGKKGCKDQWAAQQKGGEKVAALDISSGARDTVGSGNLNWKFTTLPLTDGTANSGGCAPVTGALGGKIVIIDPGHGGNGNSFTATVSGVNNEAQHNWQVAQIVKTKLEANQYKVFITKDSETPDTPLPDRVAFANSHNGTVFVSLHSNASGGPGPMGLVYCLHDKVIDDDGKVNAVGDSDCPSSPLVDQSKKLSRDVASSVASAFSLSPLRYVGGDYGVLNGIQMPGMIIEMFAHDQMSDMDKVSGKDDQMAQAIVSGIIKFMNGQ